MRFALSSVSNRAQCDRVQCYYVLVGLCQLKHPSRPPSKSFGCRVHKSLIDVLEGLEENGIVLDDRPVVCSAVHPAEAEPHWRLLQLVRHDQPFPYELSLVVCIACGCILRVPTSLVEALA